LTIFCHRVALLAGRSQSREPWAWAGFWSLTVYNKEHLIEPNPPNRFSLGTESKSMKQNSNGSLALYFQNKSPGSDKESNWVPTPTDEFSLYTRVCWPKEYRLRQTSDSGKMCANGPKRRFAAPQRYVSNWGYSGPAWRMLETTQLTCSPLSRSPNKPATVME
jgi:hypothetical protein